LNSSSYDGHYSEHDDKRCRSSILLVERSDVALEQDVIDRESTNDVSVPHKLIWQRLVRKGEQKVAERLGVLRIYGSFAERIFDGLVVVSGHDANV
jgi:hypothetical protein